MTARSLVPRIDARSCKLMRARQMLVLFELVERVTKRDLQKRLASLQDQLNEKEQEAEQIRQRIRATENRLAQTSEQVSSDSSHTP